MPVYPLIVDDWQFACCGEPFAVGDTVGFPLELIDPARFPGELHVDLTRATPAGAIRNEAGEGLQLVRAGGLVVALPPAGRPAGVLHEQRHGGLPDSMPRTEGVVERLAVGRVRYERRDGEWAPMAGTLTLAPVERTPEAFAKPEGEGPAWGEAGLVVHLRVEDRRLERVPVRRDAG
jgi:hypothetical protein